MVAKCTGIIPIIPDLVSASGMKIGAVYKRVYGFTDLRGRPAGRGRARHGPPNQVTAGSWALSLCRLPARGYNRRRRRSGGAFVTETTNIFHPRAVVADRKNNYGARARKVC